MQMERQRNNTLEILKLLAAYMVVFIHFHFYGVFGIVGDALARFAVPLFFVVSGFYSYQIPLTKIKKRISHISCLMIFAALLYILKNIAGLLLTGNTAGLCQYFERYLSPEVLIKLFVFNVPRSSEHLWFLLALIYEYIIFYFVTKHNISDVWIFRISLFCMSIHLILGEFFSAIGIAVPTMIVRNFLFMGIPFFGAGMLAKKYEQSLRQAPVFIIFTSLAIGISETLFSRKMFGKNELYIGSLFICFSAVVLFIKYSTRKYSSTLVSIAGCNTYIYILHMLVGSITGKLYTLVGVDYHSSVIVQMLHPLIICFFSTVIAYGIYRIKNNMTSKLYKAE